MDDADRFFPSDNNRNETAICSVSTGSRPTSCGSQRLPLHLIPSAATESLKLRFGQTPRPFSSGCCRRPCWWRCSPGCADDAARPARRLSPAGCAGGHSRRWRTLQLPPSIVARGMPSWPRYSRIAFRAGHNEL